MSSSERVSLVERRVEQLEASLSTAIEALTGVLQDREREKASPKASLPLQHDEALQGPPHMANELATLQRENVRLEARVRVLEGYMKAVLAFVEAQEQETRNTHKHETRGNDMTNVKAESPVLEPRVSSALAATITPPESRTSSSERHQEGTPSATTNSTTTTTTIVSDVCRREARIAAQEAVTLAVAEERARARRERQAELAAFRQDMVAHVLATSGGNVGDRTVVAVNASRSPSPDADVGGLPLEALKQQVRAWVSAELEHASSALAIGPAGNTNVALSQNETGQRCALVDARLAAVEAIVRAEARRRDSDIASVQDMCRGLASALSSLQDQVVAIAAPKRDPLAKKEEEQERAPVSLSDNGRDALRRELLSTLQKRFRAMTLEWTDMHEAMSSQQEAALLALQEEQQSLRSAVRTLVTPSAVLQGLDQRLRVLREDVKSLQQQVQSSSSSSRLAEGQQRRRQPSQPSQERKGQEHGWVSESAPRCLSTSIERDTEPEVSRSFRLSSRQSQTQQVPRGLVRSHDRAEDGNPFHGTRRAESKSDSSSSVSASVTEASLDSRDGGETDPPEDTQPPPDHKRTETPSLVDPAVRRPEERRAQPVMTPSSSSAKRHHNSRDSVTPIPRDISGAPAVLAVRGIAGLDSVLAAANQPRPPHRRRQASLTASAVPSPTPSSLTPHAAVPLHLSQRPEPPSTIGRADSVSSSVSSAAGGGIGGGGSRNVSLEDALKG